MFNLVCCLIKIFLEVLNLFYGIEKLWHILLDGEVVEIFDSYIFFFIKKKTIAIQWMMTLDNGYNNLTEYVHDWIFVVNKC